MRDMGTKGAAFVLASLALAFLAAALVFARTQNVWIDETTQLAGSVLPIGRMLAWLAGAHDPAVAVPPDRAPPLSYLIDAACARSGCATPLAFRLLHLAIVLTGVVWLLVAIARRHGPAAVVTAAALLFLSPKLVEYSVEIRPYPLFIALTCGQLALLAPLVEDRQLRWRRLLPFAGVGILATYAHFFGLVSSMALLGGLFAARVRGWRDALMIGGTAALVFAMAIGLKPYVIGASAISQAPLPGIGIGVVVQFLLKLVGQPVTLLWLPLAIAFFGATAVLLGVAAIRAGRDVVHRNRHGGGSMAIALWVALALGLGVPLAVTALPHGFDPIKPTYSLWTLPVLAWLAGIACAPAPPDAPRAVARGLVDLARGSAVVMIAAQAAILALFVAHADWFVHGPDRAIAASLGPERDADGNRMAVVYRGDWQYGYFPTLWRYRERIGQWVLLPNGTLHRLTAAAIDAGTAKGDAFTGVDRVLLVDITPRRYLDLRSLLAGAPAREQMVRVAAPTGFVVAERRTLPGLYWTTLTGYDRRHN